MTRGRASLLALLAALVGAALAAAVLLGGGRLAERWLDGAARGPDPTTIVDASLRSVQRMRRLTVFAASFATVVTSEQRRFGLSARKTLIVPGTVRYSIDLARLTRADVAWNAETRTLRLRAPALLIEGPEIDLRRMREYQDGALLFALTDAEATLDQANRTRVQASLLAQARAPALMALARDSARDALERSFALPLEAAGVRATVVVG